MPIHDWTRVDAGLFHAFHQDWIISLCRSLNAGVLPPDFFALAEQSVGGPVPDVLTLELAPAEADADRGSSALAVALAPPRVRVVRRIDERQVYVRKADRVVVRHRHGRVVAIVEIVSPGNKSSRTAVRAFVEKTADLIDQGIHALVIDLFPPSRRDPHGIHTEIWDELTVEDFNIPADRPLILASYDAGPPTMAYVEPVGVGDVLPDMPLFLSTERYVPAPLESTYQASWANFPRPMKRLLERPEPPALDG